MLLFSNKLYIPVDVKIITVKVRVGISSYLTFPYQFHFFFFRMACRPLTKLFLLLE